MIQTQKTIRSARPLSDRKEFSRLISAAVVNQHFRHLLIHDPLGAISNGYGGEQFAVDDAEKSRISAINASSLADFANQLAAI